MTFKRILIDLADRPGGRTLLGWVATMLFRMLTKQDVSIFWDKSWFSRHNSEYISDSNKFAYYKETFLNHKTRVDRRRRDGRDHWFFKYQPKSGDVIVDVGAGSGHELAIFSLPVGDSGTVLAIEAHPRTYERLEKTCRYNKYKNVILKNCAITDRAGSIQIEDSEEDESNAVFRNIGAAGHTVDSMTLDELCRELTIDHIDFLKMNIEGAEQWAILGMKEIIKRTAFVAIACHDFRAASARDTRFRTREKVSTFLLENGFIVIDRAADPRPYVRDHIHAWRTG